MDAVATTAITGQSSAMSLDTVLSYLEKNTATMTLSIWVLSILTTKGIFIDTDWRQPHDGWISDEDYCRHSGTVRDTVLLFPERKTRCQRQIMNVPWLRSVIKTVEWGVLPVLLTNNPTPKSARTSLQQYISLTKKRGISSYIPPYIINNK